MAHRRLAIAGTVALTVAIALFPHPARAEFEGVQKFLAFIMSQIVFFLIQAIGNLTSMVTHVLVIVSQFNEFTTFRPVEIGYNVVRDISFMFFIVAMLIIAGATVLNLKEYGWTRWLSRVVIYAFLVFQAKFITGFLIQAAQVVMLTFVNAFKDALYGNFVDMLGLTKILQFSDTATETAKGDWSVLISLIAGLVVLVVAFIVIAAMTWLIVVRVVALWILTILSPFAYAMKILPWTQGRGATWWSEFGRYTVQGPVIAFFIWLSMYLSSSLVGGFVTPSTPTSLNSEHPTSIGRSIGRNSNVAVVPAEIGDIRMNPPGSGVTSVRLAAEQESEIQKQLNDYNEQTFEQVGSGFNTAIFDLKTFAQFMISITFLIFGLKQATDMGGAGAGFAKKISSGGFKLAGGAAMGLTGLNALRDRTLAPVQGYLKTREARRTASIARRTQGFTKMADMVESRTIGSVGRVKRGVVTAGVAAAKQVPGQTVQLAKAVGAAAEITAASLAAPTTAMRKKGLQSAKEMVTSAAGQGTGKIFGDAGAKGGFMAGMKQGSEGERIRRVEIAKADQAGAKFAQDIGQFEKASADQRRNLAMHGRKDERLAALKVMAEKGELETRKKKEPDAKIRGENEQLAKEYGRRLLELSQSVEEAEKATNGLAPHIRQAMFGKLQTSPMESGKRELLAGLGFVLEAFAEKFDATGNIIAAKTKEAMKYMQQNESRIAEQMKKSFISHDTIGNKDLLKAIHGLDKVDDDVIVEGTKNDEFAEKYKRTMYEVMGEIHAPGVSSYNLETPEGKAQEKLRRSFVTGSRGGSFKLRDEDKDEDKVSSIFTAYGAAKDNEFARTNAERFIRTQGKNFTKYEYDQLNAGPDKTFIRDLVTKNIGAGALSTIFEKQPKSVEQILTDVRDWVVNKDDTQRPAAYPLGTKWDYATRKALAEKVNRAARSDAMAGIIQPIDTRKGTTEIAGHPHDQDE